jgi:hypothetical protein
MLPSSSLCHLGFARATTKQCNVLSQLLTKCVRPRYKIRRTLEVYLRSVGHSLSNRNVPIYPLSFRLLVTLSSYSPDAS